MSQPVGRPPHPDVLTPEEWRVLEHVREGVPDAEIAVRLGISVNTVQYHVSNMLAKLEVADRQALAAWDGEPKRRFGWLPGLPRLAFDIGAPGLGALWRGVAVIGVAGAVAVIAAVIATNDPPPEEALIATNDRLLEEGRTSVVLMDISGAEQTVLTGIDPATGAPLVGLNPLGTAHGGLIGLGGGLIWIADSPPGDETAITVIDSSRIGLAPSGLAADDDGIVRRWTLPRPDNGVAEPVRQVVSNPHGRIGYAFRTVSGQGPDELWRFDVVNDQATLVTTALESARLFLTSDGRLFLLGSASTIRETSPTGVPELVEQSLSELDPDTGREIARAEINRRVSASRLTTDERHIYLFHDSADDPFFGGLEGLTVVDLSVMAIVDQRSLPADTAALRSDPWGTAFSPDDRLLYVAGLETYCSTTTDAPSTGFVCPPDRLGVRVIDLDTMEVLYEDLEANQLALTPDGRWLVTLLSRQAEDGRLIGTGLKVIDATSLKVVAHVEPDAPFRMPAISADGRHAYVISDGPGGGSNPFIDRCVADCSIVTVVDLERLEVIATHTYDAPGLLLYSAP